MNQYYLGEIVDGYGEGDATSLTPGNWAMNSTSKQSVSVRVGYNDDSSDFERFGFNKEEDSENDLNFKRYLDGGYMPYSGKTDGQHPEPEPEPEPVPKDEYERTIIESSTPWLYLDENTDPFIETPLYQIGNSMGYADALNAYRYAWSLPTSPYSDPALNALAGTTLDIGVDDSSWNSANGPFGYKNATAPEAWGDFTPLNGNIYNSSDRVQTYFFRYNFELEDASWVNSARYTLRYDDAVVIYINKTEIGRFNTPVEGYSQNLAYGVATAPGDYLEASDGIAIPSGLL
ncbi:MAG: hypothetical protein LBU32_08765 [Clostridiales bacterium]|jgi:hypothetical protein|nr:hypothetical protein [Clostridiales bacterium]